MDPETPNGKIYDGSHISFLPQMSMKPSRVMKGGRLNRIWMTVGYRNVSGGRWESVSDFAESLKKLSSHLAIGNKLRPHRMKTRKNLWSGTDNQRDLSNLVTESSYSRRQQGVAIANRRAVRRLDAQGASVLLQLITTTSAGSHSERMKSTEEMNIFVIRSYVEVTTGRYNILRPLIH